jgi:hypothetical protein
VYKPPGSLDVGIDGASRSACSVVFVMSSPVEPQSSRFARLRSN